MPPRSGWEGSIGAFAVAEPQKPLPVKMFCGLICAEGVDVEEVLGELVALFGGVEDRFGPHRFDTYTTYYSRQMGAPLWRHFFSFEPLADPDFLVEAKIRANLLERRWMGSHSRRVNLDPGYIHPARLVLASCKDFAHRIYLGRGIYGEVTLLWRRGRWEALPWTFPDFAGGAYFEFFARVRRRYMHQLQRKEQEQ